MFFIEKVGFQRKKKSALLCLGPGPDASHPGAGGLALSLSLLRSSSQAAFAGCLSCPVLCSRVVLTNSISRLPFCGLIQTRALLPFSSFNNFDQLIVARGTFPGQALPGSELAHHRLQPGPTWGTFLHSILTHTIIFMMLL